MMKRLTPIFLLLILYHITACKTNSVNTQDNKVDTFGTAEHYQKHQRNIDRLYHMLQGTFVHYTKFESSDTLAPWKVNNNQDSVVLHVVPIKEPAKDGYWLICYQFITHLPNDPVYCAVQKLEPIDRDTFRCEFFDSPTEIKLGLLLNDLKKLSKSIDLDKLTSRGEIVTYHREEITVFKGVSNIYKDPQNQYKTYRQEDYIVNPKYLQFTPSFFEDKNGKVLIDREKSSSYEMRSIKKVASMIDQELLGK